MSHAEWNLLSKTELRIAPIRLEGVDLDAVAETVAEVLGLARDEVYVIDAIGNVLSLDILRDTVEAQKIAGRSDALLQALKLLPGVGIDEQTQITSDGVLGWIAMDPVQSEEILQRSQTMAEEIHARIARRALVFSTGSEVVTGQIIDTNKPWIASSLRQAGFLANEGANLDDDLDTITGALRRAVFEGGYGLVVTTGGVGAESKDCTIEALLQVDPQAVTPTILAFEAGHGRHAKAGVRIGVGRVGPTTLVCLPGPHDEVRIAIEVLLQGLAEGWRPAELAQAIAGALRARFNAKMTQPAHPHRHHP